MTDQPMINAPAEIEITSNGHDTAKPDLGLPTLQRYKVTLSNGYELWVHECAFEDLPVYFRAMPSLLALAKIFSTYDQETGLSMGQPVAIPREVMDGITPLFSVMTDIPLTDFKRLRIEDGLMVLLAMAEFAPKNQGAAQ